MQGKSRYFAFWIAATSPIKKGSQNQKKCLIIWHYKTDDKTQFSATDKTSHKSKKMLWVFAVDLA